MAAGKPLQLEQQYLHGTFPAFENVKNEFDAESAAWKTARSQFEITPVCLAN